MLDLSKDERCKSIETAIDQYAALVEERQIRCGRLKKTLKSYEINSRYPYPYGDVQEHHMLESLVNYISSRSQEDDEKMAEENKKQIAGRFMFKIKKYHGHPFEKHMAKMIDLLVSMYPLHDKDKINYIKYVLEVQNKHNTQKFGIYQDSTWYKLANFDLEANEENARKLGLKLYTYLKRKKITHDKDAKLIYGMLNSFINGNKDFSRNHIRYITKFYFRLAEKSSSPLDSKLLENAMFREKGGLNRDRIKDVLSLYASHLKDSRKVNENLHNQMIQLISDFDFSENCGSNDREALMSVFDGLGKNKKEYVEKIRSVINRNILESLRTRPSRPNILEKMRGFFAGSKDSLEIEQSFEDLYSDIKKNAKMRGINIEHQTFWDTNTYEINAVDKKLVKDLADIYACACESGKTNECMEEAATRMFSRLVCNNDYTEKDVAELQRRFVKNKYTNKSLIRLSKEIKEAYERNEGIKADNSHCFEYKKIIFPKGNTR